MSDPQVKITVRHEVEPGDNLSRIAFSHKTKVAHIINYNPKLLDTPNLIFPGEVFVVHKEVITP